MLPLLVSLLSLFLIIPQTFAFMPSSPPAPLKELKILRISPEGADVPTGRQIVIQFNRPVAPLGKAEQDSKSVPVEIEPRLECHWRWLNTSTLACNLDEESKLKASTSYTITVNPGIKTEDGVTIQKAHTHKFTTLRPKITYAWVRKWISPGTPEIKLIFNQPVDRKSVESTLSFTATPNGTIEDYILQASPDPEDNESTYYTPSQNDGSATDLSKSQPEKNRNLLQGNQIEVRESWIVTPSKELPLDQAVKLKVRAGLSSIYGNEKGAEDNNAFEFHTFPEFAFLGIKCYTNEDDPVLIVPNKPETQKLCNPMRGAALVFNSPVLRPQIKENITFNPEIELDTQDYSKLSQQHIKGETYDVWLPYGLKAATEYKVKSKEKAFYEKIQDNITSWFSGLKKTNLRDEFARPLSESINITFNTGHRKPNFEIIHSDAVLEKQIDSDIPLYVNNLNKTIFHYRKLTPTGAAHNLYSIENIPDIQDIQFAVPFRIREMLEGKSGALYGQLSTEPHVSHKHKSQSRLFAQVTPYQVHVKLGHFNSIIWVTDLATGLPVENAKVTIYIDKLTELNPIKNPISQGTTSKDGTVMLAGTEKLNPSLNLYNKWDDENERLFVRVDKHGEMALMPISYAFLVDSYRSTGESVYYYNKERYGHIKAWGTTAQGIYRAGDTIQYKLFVRNQDNYTFTPAPKVAYSLEVIDPIGNKVFEIKKLELNNFGAHVGEFMVPKQSPVGWYQFRLSANFIKKECESNKKECDATENKLTWYPIRVLVSDFTPSPFRVTNQINGELFQADQNVEVSTQAKLHSGGAYTDANVRITALLESKTFSPKHPLAQSFIFGSYTGEYNQNQIFQKIDRINNIGENTVTFKLPKQKIYYGRLMLESAVQDDRGKYITATSYADYASVNRFIGIKVDDWIAEVGKAANISYLVTDENGKLVEGVKADIRIERQEAVAAKVKGAGNAYLTEFTNHWVLDSVCHGSSESTASSCKFTPQKPGYHRVVARITDTMNNEHITEAGLYVIGKSYVLWNEPNDYSLEIIPEKSTYKVGDKARYLIKNPYPGAKALVSIERYGVLDHYVQTLEGSTPIIEFEVKPDYIPGFYLSVMVFSPRVEKPVEKQVDLGKPTFRIGYLTVPIKDDYKEILVTAKTNKQIYKPREKINLKLHAELKFKDKQEPIELAVAVLDESVFDLIVGGKDYFNPYLGFYKLEGLDLRNYSLLTRLVGRQKFEKKGANPGGDGGSDLSMRSLFKFVSYWNPSIALDKNGDASVEFEVPDNLTGWRVLTLAVTPSDRMGLGDANFKVNRPTELRPVMPNQVIESDEFNAVFSVMNRTDKKRDITVIIQASGSVDDKTSPTLQKLVSLEPYQRKTLWLPVKASALNANQESKVGKINFKATAKDKIDGDQVEHTLIVNKKRSIETFSSYGSTTEELTEEPIIFPTKIYPDTGELSTTVSPSIIGNIEGAFKYIQSYPYTCWEQLLTKGIIASQYKKLNTYLSKDFKWEEVDKLPTEILGLAPSFQAPNGGMSYFIPQDQYADPYLSVYTALAFNWLKASGYKIPAENENRLHSYLGNFLKHDALPSFYSKDMESTIRAAALAALAQNDKATIADLERHYPRLAEMSLLGKNYFIQAAMYVKGGDSFVIEGVKTILSYANQSSGKLSFNEELGNDRGRILSSPLRENCAILSTFIKLNEYSEVKELTKDIPSKMVNFITQSRGNRAHWENTQENAFCVNALADYAQVYENVNTNMQVVASLDGKQFGSAEFSSVKDKPSTFVRNIEPNDLGKTAKVAITRHGNGKLYYTTRIKFASLEEPKNYTNSGIEIKREYSVERDGKWVLLKTPFKIAQSELVKVDIFLSLPTARNFVVVEDPIPGGLEPIDRNLATSSIVDAGHSLAQHAAGSIWFNHSDWVSFNLSRWSFYHRELRHDFARFYSDYLPAGNYYLSYTAQAIASGDFAVMPIKTEEMYDPDIFGKGIREQLQVSPQS